jgi:hypothetical protein
MARVRILILWLLFLGILVAFLISLPPGLDASSAQYNAGVVRSGETVTHTFRARKTGLINLRVLKVESSCTCLRSTVTIDKGHVDVQLVMTTPNHAGPIAGEVVLTTNGFWANKHVFRIQGNCKAPLEIRPVAIDFGFFQAARKNLSTRTAEVEYDPEACGEITVGVDDPSGAGVVSANLEGQLGERRREVPIGPLTASLVFTFGRGTIEPVRLRCLGVAQGPFTACPPEAFFPRVPADRPTSVSIRVQPSIPFQILEVVGDPNRRIQASVEQVNGEYSLNVSVRPATPEEKTKAHLAVVHLLCADSESSRIQVPVLYQDE